MHKLAGGGEGARDATGQQPGDSNDEDGDMGGEALVAGQMTGLGGDPVR